MIKHNVSNQSHVAKTAVVSVVLGAVIMFAFFTNVQAGDVSGIWSRASHVEDNVTDNNNGTWAYDFTLFNDSRFIRPDENGTGRPLIVDWELPYFSDAGISDIVSPFNWSYAIETIGTENPLTGWSGIAAWQDPLDPFYAGDDSPFTTATQVLHWYSDCWVFSREGFCEFELQDAIRPDASLSGFGFAAAYDETAAPYQASWDFLPIQTGDPAFPLGGLPASPNTIGVNVPIPEPTTLSLAGLGLLIAGAVARRRKKQLG